MCTCTCVTLLPVRVESTELQATLQVQLNMCTAMYDTVYSGGTLFALHLYAVYTSRDNRVPPVKCDTHGTARVSLASAHMMRPSTRYTTCARYTGGMRKVDSEEWLQSTPHPH